MKVAVTGGSGKIGRAVVRHLRERGHDVLSLDIVPPADQSLPFRVLDLRAASAVRKAFDGQDAVCHLGEWANVYVGPAETYATNCEIGSTVMSAAKQAGIGRFIYTSTCQVYGFWGSDLATQPAPPLPIDELTPLRPQNAYALSKVSNEAFARLMAADGSMPIAAFRFPFVTNASQIEGMGRYRRHSKDVMPEGFGTYIASDDAARAFVLALDAGWTGFEAFHFVADDLLFDGNFKELMQKVWPGLTFPAGWSADTMPVTTAKARQRLGWTTAHSLRDAYIAAFTKFAQPA